MTTDNDIVESLLEHADAHASVSPYDDEQARWERELREAAAEIVRLREDNLRQANAMYADGMASELMDIAPAEAKDPAPAMPNGVEAVAIPGPLPMAPRGNDQPEWDHDSENSYVQGWNDCRSAALAALAQPQEADRG